MKVSEIPTDTPYMATCSGGRWNFEVLPNYEGRFFVNAYTEKVIKGTKFSIPAEQLTTTIQKIAPGATMDSWTVSRCDWFERNPKIPDGTTVYTDGFASLNKRRVKEIFVYFIEGAGKIKIGQTDNLKKRMDTFRMLSPVELRVLKIVKAKGALERHLHRRFSYLRSHGEWFDATPELRAFIESVNEDYKY